MTDPATIAGLAMKAAEILAPELVKIGAGRVKRRIVGTPAEQGMRDVYTRSLSGLLIEIAQTDEQNNEQSGTSPNPEAMTVADTVLGELCRDEEAAALLLNVALRPGPVPVHSLRQRADALGHAPDTLPFIFDDAMETLAGKVYEEFLEEAKKENSRVQPLVNEATLAFMRNFHFARWSQDQGPDYSKITPSQPEEDVVAEALATLERLEPGELPQRGPLPHPAIMPLRPNPNFVGRERDLKEIAALLKEGGAAAIGEVIVAASSGLGGMGKTQLACEFVYCYGRYFHGVYWLNFGDPARIPAEVASCGSPGGMNLRPEAFSGLSVEECVRTVVSEWQADLPRLLIFDNCEDEKLLEQWIPPTGGCRVLVTSRNATWDDFLGVTALNLGVLSRQNSVKLLRKYQSDLPENDPELNAIAEELGDLPLALDLAGRYLKRYARDIAPATYLGEIRDPRLLQHPSLRQAKGISQTKHEMDVWRTFAVSYRRLDADDDIDLHAIRLLARAARIAPGKPIPEELLTRSLDPDGASGTGMSLPATLVRDALDRLTEVGLLGEEQEGIYGMHRLVAAFALAEAPDDEAGTAVEAACSRASLRVASEGNPAKQELLIPHVLFLADAAMERVDDAAADLCLAADVGLGQLGAYAAALPYAQRAMDITEELYGPYRRLTLQRRTNVGRLFRAMGQRETAKDIYEEVLRDQETHLGRNDMDVAATINNMGVLLWHEDLFHVILPLYRRALRIRERAWRRTDLNDAKKRRENASNLAQSHANMGALLMDLGRPQQAGPHLDAALDLLTNEFGPDHERNANTLVIRGSALRALGHEREALDSFTGALDIYKNVTSSPTESAGRAITHLGSLCAVLAEDEGVYDHQRAPLRERAADCLQAALTGSEGAYGEDHFLVGAMHRALAKVQKAQGDHTEARRHRDKADSCRELNLRGADAEAATGISRSGRSLVEWGLNDEAEVYLRRALEIRKEVLGERSLVTSNSFVNLGILLRIWGENARAREMLQRALDARTEVCGPTHPATELVRENLRLLDG